MSHPTFTKTFVAPAAIEGRRVVTFGAADGQVATASAVSNTLLGISEQIGSRGNDRVDVILAGLAEVEAGGAITRGDALTTNASGQAVTATQASDSIVGIAMKNAVAGDIIDVLIAQG